MQDNPFQPSADGVSRRSFLKLGLAGTATLGLAGLGGSLAGCGKREEAAAAGLHYLRDADVALFRALAPVALKGSLSAETTKREVQLASIVRGIDEAGRRLGPPAQRELHKLLDLLHLRPTRWLTTGVGAPWPQASETEIAAFLARWESSSVGLFNAGYAVLMKLCCAGFFGQPDGWAVAGYPGPLAWAYQSLNS
jgi:hypothetical protein